MTIALKFGLQLHQDLSRIEFDDIKRYASALEHALEREREMLNKESAERTAKMSEEQKFDYYDCAADEFQRFEESFPKVLRYSLFAHAYSLFEHTLLGIAEEVRRQQNLELSLADLRDDGVTRARTYLKKIAKLPFPDTGCDWQTIQMLNQIRNFVVHRAGHCPEDHPKAKAIEQFFAAWPGSISLDANRNFVFSERFIYEFTQFCQKFLATVFNDIGGASSQATS